MNLTSFGLRLGGNTAGTRQSVEKSEVLAHEARDLIANMLDERAEERPSMQAVLNHPMFWSMDAKIKYLGESVGLILPVKIDKSKVPVVADLEAVADAELGGSFEEGGSWARLLDQRYPLPGVKNDGWGKVRLGFDRIITLLYMYPPFTLYQID
jgi:hypothetical protein